MRRGLGLLLAAATLHSKFAYFAARLDGGGPLGVAVSGGGDSVALLYALAEWGKRPLEVFCVNHGLNPLSAQWTQSVADHAAHLNAGFTALHWTGDKPATGLSAAARMARHRLLAEAAREKGVRVLCLAHTADDVAEAEAMRQQGSTVGTPRQWSPSPVWPEGRGVFLYRPFLDIRRETLRDYLRQRGATWIDDPANTSPASLRARMRKQLAENIDIALLEDLTPAGNPLSPQQNFASSGLIAFDAAAIYALPRQNALRWLSTAAVCAGGGDRLPKSTRVAALYGRLGEGAPHTLAGARIRQVDNHILIAREAGDIGRNRPGELHLVAGETGIWDGRYAITATTAGTVMASAGLRPQLNDSDCAAISALPAMLRATQPVWRDLSQNDNPHIYLMANPSLKDGQSATCLVKARFRAASGQILRESDIGSIA